MLHCYIEVNPSSAQLRLHMEMYSHCKIKITRLLLLLNWMMFLVVIVAVPSSDDLKYLASPELETLAEFENDTFSEPFIFKYENFVLDYVVACRIGTNVTFAVRSQNTGKLLSVDEDRYDVVGGDIGAEGEFQISLRGNINEQDGNCLVCGFATAGFVMETSCIRLKITKKPVYYLEQRPDIAITGDEVEIYCVVSGYPFPSVKFTPPFYLPVETRLMSLPNETLRVIKYVSTINYIDVSWKDEPVKCQVYNDDTVFKEKVMRVFVKRYNESIVFDDQTVSTIAVVCAILAAFLMASMMLGIVMYMKRRNQREIKYCMKINGFDGDDNERAPLNYTNNNQHFINNKTAPPVPAKIPKSAYCPPPCFSNKPTNYKQAPKTNTRVECAPPKGCQNQPTKTNTTPQTAAAPPTPRTKFRYYPQQIINVTQKHSHHNSKPKPNDIKKGVNNPTVKTTSECKTPNLSYSPPKQTAKQTKQQVVGKTRHCEKAVKSCDKKPPPINTTNHVQQPQKTRKINISTSAFV